MGSGKKLCTDFKGARGEFFEKMNLLPIWDLKNSPFWGGEKSSEKPQNAPPFDIVRGWETGFVGKSPILFFLSAKFYPASLESTLLLIWCGGHKMDLPDRFSLKADFQRRSAWFRFRNSDLQSEFSMLSYSYWQNMMHCCIILTVNLLTWRKVSPVFYWKTEPFIPAHDSFMDAPCFFAEI